LPKDTAVNATLVLLFSACHWQFQQQKLHGNISGERAQIDVQSRVPQAVRQECVSE
jgi:outer membrane lipopolysaccharide assembly protein LptE/RlpB